MTTTQTRTQEDLKSAGHYAAVNGLRLYYETYGTGSPLVLLHGGGSTIDSTFGRVLPSFAEMHQVIAVELQAHGRTADINRPLSFEQDADDVAALLRNLQIRKASFFGFSNGGSTVMQIAIRHPELVDKIIIASAMYKRVGLYPWLFEGLQDAKLENMPQALQEAYLRVNPDHSGLEAMFERDRQRMLTFEDWDANHIRTIQAPALVIVGDRDVVRPEHAVELFRLLPAGRLFVFPGGHGDYIGEITTLQEGSRTPEFTVAIIEAFLQGN